MIIILRVVRTVFLVSFFKDFQLDEYYSGSFKPYGTKFYPESMIKF
jgi:hypothetical protein